MIQQSAAVAAIVLSLSFSVQAATITVNTLADESIVNDECALIEAIAAANSNAPYRGCPAGSGADIINFSVTGTITLNSSLSSIAEALSIIGPGPELLTIDADNQWRIFFYNIAEPGEQFRLENMTLSNGRTTGSDLPGVHAQNNVNLVMENMVISGMRNAGTGIGGAVGGQSANITIRSSTFFDNGANDNSSGALNLFQGTTAVIEDSTFENNFVTGTGSTGGVATIGNTVNLTIRRSTFSGNTASDRGGVIAVVASNTVLNIESSTFVNNTAGNSGGALDINAGTANIRNSLFAFNLISGSNLTDPSRNINLSGSGVINTLGYNAIRDNAGAATVFPAGLPNVNNDLVGEPSDVFNPQIDVIADNGGPTRTHAIQAGSPLIDAGSCTGDTRDQRGYKNPNTNLRIVDVAAVNADDGCDIGAFERNAQPNVLNFADGFEEVPET